MTGPFTSVLIANRGEIAVRVIRACRDEGLRSIAVFDPADAKAPHVALADDAVELATSGPAGYLDIAGLVGIARASSAQAVHPGYGFLSESADFAEAVTDAGLIWIGTPASAIRGLGDKISARQIATSVGTPVLAGTTEPVQRVEEIAEFASKHGLPLAIKAAFGGGGRGLKVVRTIEEIPAAFESAVREAEVAFGRSECLLERYVERARHVEVQVLADSHGNVVTVGTRDCSVQRRHQKLVEEAPAPFLNPQQRSVLSESAKAICRAAGYRGAGTVEFLVDPLGQVAFLEVNTRLQVEHTVSEETSGIDLVREQFRIARGEALPYPEDVSARGHSIEFRINAENPRQNFAPMPGTVTRFVAASGPGVRTDSGVVDGSVVSGQFDSLLAKVIITGADRPQALQRARRALGEVAIEGVLTVLDFHRELLVHPDFLATDGIFAVHTRWIESDWVPSTQDAESSAVGAAGHAAHRAVVMIGGRAMRILVPAFVAALDPNYDAQAAAQDNGGSIVKAPMQGTIISVAVVDGEHVEPGQIVAVVEAMKMENPIRATRSGRIEGLTHSAGDTVAQGTVICTVAEM